MAQATAPILDSTFSEEAALAFASSRVRSGLWQTVYRMFMSSALGRRIQKKGRSICDAASRIARGAPSIPKFN
jgi:hypothetical protein